MLFSIKKIIIIFEMNRILQVIKYGWQHSKQVSDNHAGKNRLMVFFDILVAFKKYKMWSNQYVEEKMYDLSRKERETLGKDYREKGRIRDEWQKDFRRTRKFLNKYTAFKYELVGYREKRNKAYTNYYNTGSNLFVEYNVTLTRQHYGNGRIEIGDHVLLARDVDIDYTGDVIIGNRVALSEGVKILSHAHDIELYDYLDKNKKPIRQTPLTIGDRVWVGSKAIIMPGVGEIGRGALIGAGTVVEKKVPPYAIVKGNPAKIIGFRLTPKEIVAYEKNNYKEEDCYAQEYLEQNYQKYFLNRVKEIKDYLKL